MFTDKSSDILTVTAIKNGLNTKVIGNEVIVYETVSSTMDIARYEVGRGASEGMAIFAEHQTAGKGRRGRVWVSPSKRGLLITVILRPKIKSDRICYLMGIASIAVTETIHHLFNISANVKWPNDINIGNKKVAGILIEVHGLWNEEPVFSIGIGINVNLTEDELPKQVLIPATSLSLETGYVIDRVKLAKTILQSLDSWYLYLKEGKYEFVRKRWSDLCLAFSKNITINDRNNKYTGKFADITHEGNLILKLQDNTLKRFKSEYISTIP